MADHGRNNQRRPPHFPGIFGVGFSLSPETCKGILACSLISSSATVPGFLVFSVCPQHVKSVFYQRVTSFSLCSQRSLI